MATLAGVSGQYSKKSSGKITMFLGLLFSLVFQPMTTTSRFVLFTGHRLHPLFPPFLVIHSDNVTDQLCVSLSSCEADYAGSSRAGQGTLYRICGQPS